MFKATRCRKAGRRSKPSLTLNFIYVVIYSLSSWQLSEGYFSVKLKLGLTSYTGPCFCSFPGAFVSTASSLFPRYHYSILNVMRLGLGETREPRPAVGLATAPAPSPAPLSSCRALSVASGFPAPPSDSFPRSASNCAIIFVRSSLNGLASYKRSPVLTSDSHKNHRFDVPLLSVSDSEHLRISTFRLKPPPHFP